MKLTNFNWEHYLENNPDLLKDGIDTELKAIKHYNRHGKKEGRCFLKTNDTSLFTGGRFGNRIFINLVTDYVARINKLKINYIDYAKFIELGIPLFSNNNNSVLNKNHLIVLNDSNIDNIFTNTDLIKNKNLVIDGYFQTPIVARYIKNIIILNKENIIKNNKYLSNTNTNLFVHVRLGDIINLNYLESYEYYDKAINNISFEKGYISSDSINNETCQKLIKKYNLEVFSDNEVNTIHFASTCKNIVLSSGTFSWIIGLFGSVLNDSKVYYPVKKQNRVIWHGDIFVFSEWNKIIY